MRVVISLKVVPDYEQVRMAQGATVLDVAQVPRVVYTFDELALEMALRIKDKNAGTELIVVSMSPDAAKVREVVKKALAMGADRAVIVEDAAFGTADSWSQAQVLKAVVEKLGEVSLLSYGIPGIQGEAFPLGVEVGHLLNWPVVSYASEMAVTGDTVAVVRHIEGGKQSVDVPMPAVVTIGKFQADPRLPTFKGIMGAKNKPLEVWSLADLAMTPDALGHSVRQTAVAPPSARGAGRKIEGDAVDVAKEAIASLRGRKFV
jgi:electron transfer flavoprotein beta subunit